MSDSSSSSKSTKHDSGNNSTEKSTGRPLRVAFVHLDWGIGGAEQLMLQLAQASVEVGHSVQLWTTHCDPNHCFAPLKPHTGTLHPYLQVCGEWIPQDLGGAGRAICSTLRVIYLAYCLCHRKRSRHEPLPDVIVLDVLPTPLLFFQWWMPSAALLFYCHFPDQLLTSNATIRVDNDDSKDDQSLPSEPSSLPKANRSLYRKLLDFLEDSTMPFADAIVVNSQFTQKVVQKTFASLQSKELPVLYPALDTTALDQKPITAVANSTFDSKPLVSLNRYERKKNVLLLLEAVQWIQQHYPSVTLPPIIIAGGYDKNNIENVEYRGELQHYVEQHNLQSIVTFQQSISDAQRTQLLREALAVIYTPTNEHFGIVPLEAMYCETPVVAVNTGGPTETILHEWTGFLCDPTPAAFGRALLAVIQDPVKAQAMGREGRKHVIKTFGSTRMVQEWRTLCQETVLKGQQRQHDFAVTYHAIHILGYLADAIVTFVIVWLLTVLFRTIGVLHASESIWGAAHRAVGWRPAYDTGEL